MAEHWVTIPEATPCVHEPGQICLGTSEGTTTLTILTSGREQHESRLPAPFYDAQRYTMICLVLRTTTDCNTFAICNSFTSSKGHHVRRH